MLNIGNNNIPYHLIKYLLYTIYSRYIYRKDLATKVIDLRAFFTSGQPLVFKPQSGLPKFFLYLNIF